MSGFWSLGNLNGLLAGNYEKTGKCDVITFPVPMGGTHIDGRWVSVAPKSASPRSVDPQTVNPRSANPQVAPKSGNRLQARTSTESKSEAESDSELNLKRIRPCNNRLRTIWSLLKPFEGKSKPNPWYIRHVCEKVNQIVDTFANLRFW